MEPRLFIWIARTLLKSFVVHKLKLFERGFGEVASGTTVIPFNSHTPSVTLPQIKHNKQCHSDIFGPFMLQYSVITTLEPSMLTLM